MGVPRTGALMQSPSLRGFLAELPDEDILRIAEPMELDYLPTALVLELEKRRRTPARSRGGAPSAGSARSRASFAGSLPAAAFVNHQPQPGSPSRFPSPPSGTGRCCVLIGGFRLLKLRLVNFGSLLWSVL